MPATLQLHEVTVLNLSTAARGRKYCAHFTGEDTELREGKVPSILELVSMPLSSLQMLCSAWSRDHCSGRQQGRKSTGLGVWSPKLQLCKSLPLSGLSVFICKTMEMEFDGLSVPATRL